ncbi:MAG TPA: SDR family NAD(P)-dependent oxidoreductase, partial [Solirubrobacteraceae bacterium]|nr:SDR family NAD(P)-dependent oxidoreductase [Solirubrobacteraceae bacterium]
MADKAVSEVFAPGALAGRVALVTGGGTGLGKATALELVRCGARVLLAGRREEVLEEATEEIAAQTGAVPSMGPAGQGGPDTTARADVTWRAGDVRDPGQARTLVGLAVESFGGLDILVNNAGGQYFTPAEGIVGKGWRAVWRLNVEGMLNMCRAAVEAGLGERGARESGSSSASSASSGPRESSPSGAREGWIVNVTLSPHHGMPGMAHSGAARATVEALTRELAERWAGDGVMVAAVAAGVFETEVLAKY